MTDEKTTPEDTKDEATTAPEAETTPDTKTDEAPPVAGEPPAAPAPPPDPNILGALTPQEIAVLGNLQRRSQQLTLELGKLDIQKSQIRSQVKATDDQSQAILMQIGQRLGIPEAAPWSVGGDGNARALPPQFLQGMQGGAPGGMPGMAPPPRQPQPAATASQPDSDEKPPKEGSKEE